MPPAFERLCKAIAIGSMWFAIVFVVGFILTLFSISILVELGSDLERWSGVAGLLAAVWQFAFVGTDWHWPR